VHERVQSIYTYVSGVYFVLVTFLLLCTPNHNGKGSAELNETGTQRVGCIMIILKRKNANKFFVQCHLEWRASTPFT
jgi:hypothetical protein